MGDAISHNSPGSLLRIGARLLVALALVAAVLGGAQTQTRPATQSAQAARVHKRVHPRKKPAVAATPTPAIPVVAAPVAPTVPEAPEAPAFPINGNPTPASIRWDNQGLRIEAANSSLQQILTDVSTDTGVQVDGLATDQRVFGVYGPGPARDVISQLLHGSGYNVLMIGDQGQGTPRRIVLSIPQPGSASPAATPAQQSDDDSSVEDQPPPQQYGTPYRPGYPPGMPHRQPQRQPSQPGEPSEPQN